MQWGKSLLSLFCLITLLVKEQQDKSWLFPPPDLLFSSYLSYGEFKQWICGDKSTLTWSS